MADVKISDLVTGTPADTDLVETETAGGAARKLTRAQLRSSSSEVKADYESNANTNAFTDSEQSKLVGVEVGATADQTNGEVKTAYEANADTNAFTDAEQSKLAGVESGATADQSAGEIKTAYESNADTNAFTDAEKTALAGASAATRTINAQTGTSYTLVASDFGNVVTANNASANAITVPTNGAVPAPVGTQVDISQLGAGVTSVSGDTGVTVNGVSAGTGALSAQFGSVTLLNLGADNWLLTGNHDAVA